MKVFCGSLLIFVIVSATVWVDISGKHISKTKNASLKKRSVKIVHGDEATPHSLPYMAAIHTTVNDKTVLCGGSLISTSLVMTSARCVSGASEAEVILGAHNIDEDEDTQLVLTSSEFIIHPDYTHDSNLHDIAIIQLPAAVTLNEYIGLVALPTLDDILTNYDDQLGSVAGWGKTSDVDQEYSSVLQAINVTIIPTLICELPYFLSLTFDQICTTGVEQKNICLGDAGSPLVVNGTQVGIASYGSDYGCEAGLPGVYTRLTSYLSWLYINSEEK